LAIKIRQSHAHTLRVANLGKNSSSGPRSIRHVRRQSSYFASFYVDLLNETSVTSPPSFLGPAAAIGGLTPFAARATIPEISGYAKVVPYQQLGAPRARGSCRR